MTDQELLDVIAPFGGGGLIATLFYTVYRFREPLKKLLGFVIKSFMTTGEDLEKENKGLKTRVQELETSLQEFFSGSDSDILEIIKGNHAGSRFVRKTVFVEDTEQLILQFVFFKDVKTLDESLSLFLIDTARLLRYRKNAVISFMLDFSFVETINSQGIGNLYSFLKDFKMNNGFKFIFIPPKEKRLSVALGPIYEIEKEITDMHILAINETISS